MNSKIEGGVALYITYNKSGVFYFGVAGGFTPLGAHLLTPKPKRGVIFFISLLNLKGMWLFYL